MHTVQRVCVAVVVCLALFAVTSATSHTKRNGGLERRVQKSEFGRQLLSAVSSQMSQGSRSFGGVQDFLYQVYKKIVNDQAEEAAAHAKRVLECETNLGRLLNATREKGDEIANVTLTVQQNNEALDSLKSSIERAESQIEDMNTALQKAQRRVDAVTRSRDGRHDMYQAKFYEAKEIVDEVQAIVNKLNLLHPDANSRAGSFLEKYSKSGNHLASFIATAQELSASPTTNALRTLFTLLDAELRKYMAILNKAHQAFLDETNAVLGTSTAERDRASSELNTVTTSLASWKQQVKNLNFFISQLTSRKVVTQKLWTNFKEQLQRLAAYCKAETEEDVKQAARRVEQLKTLAALRQLINDRVENARKAVIQQAQNEAAAREDVFKDNQRKVYELRRAYTQMQQVQDNKNAPAAPAAPAAPSTPAAPAAATAAPSTTVTRPAPATTTAAAPTTNKAASQLIGGLSVNKLLDAAAKGVVDVPADNKLSSETFIPHTCKAILKRHRQTSTEPLASGVFTVFAKKSLRPLRVYCDMETAGGGWMLAFKQFEFASGSVAYNFSLASDPIITNPSFSGMKSGDTTRGSLLHYGRPKRILFRSSVDTNWFITPALPLYQQMNTSSTSRVCLYSAVHNIYRSPSWQNSKLPLWDDTAVVLMVQPHSSISAITVGRFAGTQLAPQCVAPNCAAERHGRYQGKCQDNSRGEGNWILYVR